MIRKIENINIVNHDGIIFGDLHIEDQKIIKIIQKSDQEKKEYNYCIPGFIDQHTHGGYGISFDQIATVSDDDLIMFEKKIAKEGLCGVFLTTVTQSIDHLKVIGKSLNKKLPWILGWHIEGPFISKAKKGAHDERFITEFSKRALSEITKTNSLKKLLTIAPEIDQALKIIETNDDPLVFFSIGHSNADYFITKEAVQKGCTQFTHLYNAMSGFDHRKPGIVNYALKKSKSYVELITDGTHVNDHVLKQTYEICGPERIIIVSDCLPPKGLDNGLYHLGSLEIDKKDHICYLRNSDTLAGSAMKYNNVVKHFYNLVDCTMSDIVKMTSYNTSKQFKLKDYGIIKEGIKTKLIICDSKLNILETIF
ncbi:MAG: N-acetylglucosamine-6-phosphate deacetylase [Mycoplasmoidaceae bacterium]